MPGRLALAAAALLALGACSGEGHGTARAAAAAPAPERARHAGAPRRFTQRLFELELPAGWERVRHEDSGRVAASGPTNVVRFEDGRGRYLVVAFDHAGSEVAADAVWTLEASPDGAGLRVVAEEPPCRRARFASSEEAMNAPDDGCPEGDGRLAILAVAPELRGHRFVFLFGDAAREAGVDPRPFRAALASFRAR